MTDDRAFLQAQYPLIKGAAQFLLSHATTGADGKLHTRSNAHETQWDVTNRPRMSRPCSRSSRSPSGPRNY